MAASPLKTDPKYGYFPWWPQDGDDWVHPADVAIARSMIPSNRVFRRDGSDGEYLLMHYGSVTLRVLRTLWHEVPPVDFEIGDWVEVLSLGMRNEPRTGTIREILWDDHSREIRYQITESNASIADLYARDDLQRIDPV